MTKTAKQSAALDLSPEQLAYSQLLAYAAYMYPQYKVGHHHALIAKHLERVERGELTRLMVFLPPRSGKSFLCSEFFPAWYLGRNPTKQVIAATYSHEKAGDSGRKVRNYMVDPIFAAIFPECQVSSDQKSANHLSTLQGGNLYSVGVRGAQAGRGAHLFLVDDPLKDRKEADSEVEQKRLRDWYRAVAYTRLMPGQSAVIVIMTRWHYNDLAGWLLSEHKHENWTVLSLPAISEDDDLLGRKPGDPLWPEAYPLGNLYKIKKTVGTREWNALYQQRPLPEEGGLVNLEWFMRYSMFDWGKWQAAVRVDGRKFDRANSHFPIKKIVCSWDTAFKEKQINDPSACTVWGVTDKDYYLLYMINERLDFPKLKRRVVEVQELNCRKLGFKNYEVIVLIEDKGSGTSLIQELKRETNIPVIGCTPDANKIFRMESVSALIEAGRVWIPDRAVWLTDFETQMAEFPYGKHDDIVDSVSQFLRWINKPKFKRSQGTLFYK